MDLTRNQNLDWAILSSLVQNFFIYLIFFLNLESCWQLSTTLLILLSTIVYLNLLNRFNTCATSKDKHSKLLSTSCFKKTSQTSYVPFGIYWSNQEPELDYTISSSLVQFFFIFILWIVVDSYQQPSLSSSPSLSPNPARKNFVWRKR